MSVEGMSGEGMSVEGLTVSVTHQFPQPIGVVWSLLTDVERMAGLGPEHIEAGWDTADRALGATFHGTNRRGERSWTVPCTVISCTEPTAFGWVVGEVAAPVATWTYDLRPAHPGTTVVHTFTHGPGASGLTAAIAADPGNGQRAIDSRSATLAGNMTIALAAAQQLLAA